MIMAGAKKKNALCILCPNVGGALKPIKTNKWVHVSCVNWIPEVIYPIFNSFNNFF